MDQLTSIMNKARVIRFLMTRYIAGFQVTWDGRSVVIKDTDFNELVELVNELEQQAEQAIEALQSECDQHMLSRLANRLGSERRGLDVPDLRPSSSS